MVRCAHLLMMRCDSTSVPFSASRKRTPKMAPVDPVIPMMRRRITSPFRAPAERRGAQDEGTKEWLPFWSILEQVPEFTDRQGLILRRRVVHLGELILPVERPAGVDHGAAVGV